MTVRYAKVPVRWQCVRLDEVSVATIACPPVWIPPEADDLYWRSRAHRGSVKWAAIAKQLGFISTVKLFQDR